MAAAALVVLGRVGDLPTAPAPTRWPAWVEAIGPEVAVVAILRSFGLLACGVLSGVVLLTLVCEVLDMERTRRTWMPRTLTQALTKLRRPLAAGTVGIGLVAQIGAASAASPPLAETVARTLVVSATVGSDASTVDVGVAGAGGHSYAELRRVRIELAPLSDASPAARAPAIWIVERGEHLWGIAESALADHLGHQPGEARVARYWKRLIAANDDRFVIPGQPDVIIAGQELALPPIGPLGSGEVPLSGRERR